MARNAKLDLAKRQSVGIYRKATFRSVLFVTEPSHADDMIPLYAGVTARPQKGQNLFKAEPGVLIADGIGGGDYRAPEGAKSFYRGKPTSEMLELVASYDGMVKRCKPFRDSKGTRHHSTEHVKRAGADPQGRREMVPCIGQPGMAQCITAHMGNVMQAKLIKAR